jgi:hypothetical protein
LSDELICAYQQTSFLADTSRGHLCLRIGVSNPALDALLSAERARSWAYVTAYNPGSMPLGESENAKRQRVLEQAVREAGFLFFYGTGIGDDAQWPPEPSLLILGITRDQAVDLGRRFGQRAIVYGEAGGSPELLVGE